MRATIVGRPGTALEGVTTQCGCGKRTRQGEAVFVHRLDARLNRTTKIVLHVGCMAALVEDAPEGAPVKSARQEYVAIRRQLRSLAV